MSAGEGDAPGRTDRAARPTTGEAEQGPEVLASLPKRRPGRRSPRRDEAAAARARSAGRASSRGAQQSAPAPATGGFGVEDLVRAGISVATGAVGTGFRLTGRALGALRGAVGRR